MASSPATDTFRLGLVGAGRMGRTHLRALADSADVDVVAVAEPVDALRDEVASAFAGARLPRRWTTCSTRATSTAC